jgi:hypothetical protein
MVNLTAPLPVNPCLPGTRFMGARDSQAKWPAQQESAISETARPHRTPPIRALFASLGERCANARLRGGGCSRIRTHLSIQIPFSLEAIERNREFSPPQTGNSTSDQFFDPMLMTRRKIIAQMMIGNETRPIKAKLRNASCLWDTHQGDLWVLHFIPAISAVPTNIVQHDCENVNDQRRIPPSATEMQGMPLKLGALPSRCDPISNTPSPLENCDRDSDYYRG